MELFGFKSTKKKDKKLNPSFVAPTDFDGSIDFSVESNQFGTNFGFQQEPDSNFTESAIKTYRTMSENSDVSCAIEEIVDQAIVNDSVNEIIEIQLDDIEELSANIKKKIAAEFENTKRLFNLTDSADDLFRKWFVDGKLVFHMITNKSGSEIEELRMIDPIEIKKVQEINKKKDRNGVEIVESIDEYYLWEPKNLKSRNRAVKIAVESILSANSGIKSADGKHNISYLHRAIKPYNQLVALEDSMVVYRMARAPERRVFYVDVGNLPPARAEQYMRKVINNYKNKTVYDSRTGSVKDNKHLVSMLENIYLPRMDGSRGTSVETLPSGTDMSMDDVLYFQKKLYKALGVPVSRLDTDNSVLAVGRASEISREEVKFDAFINKLRRRFSKLFTDLLETQVVLKKIMTSEEFEAIKQKIKYKYNNNSYFAENKKQELMTARFELLQAVDSYVGKYMSIDYVRKNILNQSDAEMEAENKQIEAEKKAGLHDQGDF